MDWNLGIGRTHVDLWIQECQQRYRIDDWKRTILFLENVLGIYLSNLPYCCLYSRSRWLE